MGQSLPHRSPKRGRSLRSAPRTKVPAGRVVLRRHRTGETDTLPVRARPGPPSFVVGRSDRAEPPNSDVREGNPHEDAYLARRGALDGGPATARTAERPP